MLKLNSDKSHIQIILSSILSKDGYCCCQIFKNENSICPLIKYDELPQELESSKLCGTGIETGRCVCNVYVRDM